MRYAGLWKCNRLQMAFHFDFKKQCMLIPRSARLIPLMRLVIILACCSCALLHPIMRSGPLELLLRCLLAGAQATFSLIFPLSFPHSSLSVSLTLLSLFFFLVWCVIGPQVNGDLYGDQRLPWEERWGGKCAIHITCTLVHAHARAGF